jgi:hypothetical protein
MVLRGLVASFEHYVEVGPRSVVTGSGDDVGGMLGVVGGTYEGHGCEIYEGSTVAGNNNVGGHVGRALRINVSYGSVDSNITIFGNNNNVGGVVGNISMGGNISGLNITNDVVVSGNSNVGGIVGSTSGYINISYTNVSKIVDVEGDSNVGGFVGLVEDAQYLFIDSSTIENDVLINITSNNGGGFVGNLDSTIFGSEFFSSNISNQVNITGNPASSENIGGFVGNLDDNIFIVDSNVYQDIKIEGYEAIGGFVGYGYTNSNIYMSGISLYDDVEIYGVDSIGGLVGQHRFNGDLFVDHTRVYNNYINGNLNVGGFVGFINDGDLELNNVSVVGTTITGGNQTGGFVGTITGNNPMFLNASYIDSSTISVTLGSEAGGIFGYNEATADYENIYYPDDLGVPNFPLQDTKYELFADVFDCWVENNFPEDIVACRFDSFPDGYLSISTLNEFENFANYANGSYNWRLNNSIDLSSKLNFNISLFNGNFDGNGYTIANLTQTNGNGLFTEVENATIQNLLLTGFNVTSVAGSGVGSLTGYIYGNVNITNVNLTNSNISAQEMVGGLVGKTHTSDTILMMDSCNVYNDVIISSSSSIAGGLLGQQNSSEAFTFNNNSVFDNVLITASDKVGGIAGEINNATIIDNSIFNEVYIVGGDKAGGLIGYTGYGKYLNVTNSYNYNITINATSNVSGFVGYNDSGVFIENSYYPAYNVYPNSFPNDSEEYELAGYIFDCWLSGGKSEDLTACTFDEFEPGIFAINNEAEFEEYIYDYSDGGYYFKLNSSIDLSSYPGLNGTYFVGTLDGNGYTIKNLNSSFASGSTFDRSNGALFKYAEDATIKNLNIENITIYTQSYNSSALIAYCVNNCTLRNINATNLDINGYSNVGGLIGYSQNNSFVNLVNIEDNVNITGRNFQVGGVIGNSKGNLEIESTKVTGNVKILGSPSHGYLGGLIGRTSNSLVIIENSSVTNGVYIGGYDHIGGLVGEIYTTSSVFINSSYVDNISINISANPAFSNNGGILTNRGTILYINAYYPEDLNILGTGLNDSEYNLSTNYFDCWVNNGFPEELINCEFGIFGDGYYAINSFEDLSVYGQKYADLDYDFRLNDSIDFSSNPDFNISKIVGNFDGNGFSLENLSLNVTSYSKNWALFREAENATIENLNIYNFSTHTPNHFSSGVASSLIGLCEDNCNLININATKLDIFSSQNSGGFIGQSLGFVLIDSCNLNDSEIIATLSEGAGGFIGKVSSSSETNIYNSNVMEGVFVDGYTYGGGFIGFTNVFSNLSFYNSSVKDAVDIIGYRVGGFVGSISSINTLNFTSCSVNDSVSLQGNYVGGLIGESSSVGYLHLNSTFVDNTTIDASSDAAGLIQGLGTVSSNYTNAYYPEDILVLDQPLSDQEYNLSRSIFDCWLEDFNEDVFSCRFGVFPDGFYSINNTNQLRDYAENFADANYSFRLNATIDLSGETNFNITKLVGTFDGNGYTIANLTQTDGNGLFTDAEYATISNLSLYNITIQGTNYYVGALLGRAANDDVTIENVKGDLIIVSGDTNVGGLIGYIENGLVNATYLNNSIIINATGTNVGGIIGRNVSSYINAYYRNSTQAIGSPFDNTDLSLEVDVLNWWVENNYPESLDSYYLPYFNEKYYINDVVAFTQHFPDLADNGYDFVLNATLDLTSYPDFNITKLVGTFDGNGYTSLM